MRYRGILRDYATLWDMSLRTADAMVVILAGWLASLIYLGETPQLPGYRIGMVLAVLLCLIMFPAFGMYKVWRGRSIGDEIRTITLAWPATLMVLTLFAFLTKTGPEFSRGWFLIWLVMGWILLALSRAVLRSVLHALRRRGFNQRRVVIVASREKADELSAWLADAPWAGLVVAGIIPPESVPDDRGAVSAPAGQIHGSDDLADLVRLVGDGVEQVWIAVPLRDEATIHHVQHALRHSTADVRYVPDVSSFQLLNHSIVEVAGIPMISLSSSGMDGIDRIVKSLEDFVLASLILLLVSPLMLLIAVGVKLSSPGPILFRQRRLGIGGEEITVLKFRSMVMHTEPSGMVTQAHKADARITGFGAFLRRTSLDELPQFLNVLKGEMSIVGPRPHALEHNEQYKALIDRYMARHKIKPGITGWAQINGYRGETDTLLKMQKRVEYDLHYIENWSLWLDLKIIGLTVARGFVDRSAY